MPNQSTDVSRCGWPKLVLVTALLPDRNLLAHMYEEIRTNEFEVVSLDPLITLHGVPESNPVMMRGVMDIFRDMAASLTAQPRLWAIPVNPQSALMGS